MTSPLSIFLSWQADTDEPTGRAIIEASLQDAIDKIKIGMEVSVASRIRLDRDTFGESGMPPIFETVVRKIDAAAIFVADLTFCSVRRDQHRLAPNPNVLIEYGWALKALSYRRMIAVMNTAYGEPTDAHMPFNLTGVKRPLTYFCPPDASEDQRRAARAQLAEKLQAEIQAALAGSLSLPELSPVLTLREFEYTPRTRCPSFRFEYQLALKNLGGQEVQDIFIIQDRIEMPGRASRTGDGRILEGRWSRQRGLDDQETFQLEGEKIPSGGSLIFSKGGFFFQPPFDGKFRFGGVIGARNCPRKAFEVTVDGHDLADVYFDVVAGSRPKADLQDLFGIGR